MHWIPTDQISDSRNSCPPNHGKIMTAEQITLSTTLQIPEAIYFQEIEDEAVLLDAEGGFYFGLDPVGTRMWQLIQEHHTLQAVFDALLAEYEVTPEQLEADLIELVTKLIEKGLVVIQE
jgi:hypothetical protein